MKQGHFFTTIIASVFAMFIIAYMCVQVWRWAYNPVQTVSAVYTETEDSIELNGFVVRDEKLISASAAGVLEMIVDEGERAGKGDIIAAVYADNNALENHRKVDEIDKRIQQLNMLIHQGNEMVDIETADRAVSEQTRVLMEMTQTNSFSDLNSAVEELKNDTLSREYIYQDKSGLNQVISELKNERKKHSAAATIKKRIYAPDAGYFSHRTDGYENVFLNSEVENWTPSIVDELLKKEAVLSSDDSVIGKVVSDYKWKYVALISEEEAEYIGKTSRVKLKFDSGSYPEVDATVEKVSEAENGKVLIVFECTKHISDFTVARFLSAQLVLKTYSGLKVPREALRVNEEGENGVFCLIDSQVKFKPVEPIFEKDSYYIVAYDSANTKSLLLYDEIIIAAKELENRKVLK